MQAFFTIGLAILLFIILGGLFLLYKKLHTLQQPKEGEHNLFILLQNQIQELNRTLDKKMADTQSAMTQTQQHLHQTIQQQFGQSARIISEVTEKLTKLDETNKQVVSVAEQLQGLENVLKNPKHRGVLGEYYLENVLKNVMP